ARLRAFPKYMDDTIALMREGLRTGTTMPKESLAGIETSITPLLPDDPTKSALYEPFTTIPATIDAATRERLATQGRAAITENVTPAYKRFLEFMTKDYVPHARATLAA